MTFCTKLEIEFRALSLSSSVRSLKLASNIPSTTEQSFSVKSLNGSLVSRMFSLNYTTAVAAVGLSKPRVKDWGEMGRKLGFSYTKYRSYLAEDKISK